MWEMALATEPLQAAIAGAPSYRRGLARLFGIPESEIAATLRAAEDQGLDLDGLEITTCLRRGEIEVSTRYAPEDEIAYEALVEFMRARHGDVLFSPDGETVDEQVAALLAGRTVAVAESCTGGLMSARLTERPGSSAYMLGGVGRVLQRGQGGAGRGRCRADRARSEQSRRRWPRRWRSGRCERFDADFGIGITGIAGPGWRH